MLTRTLVNVWRASGKPKLRRRGFTRRGCTGGWRRRCAGAGGSSESRTTPGRCPPACSSSGCGSADCSPCPPSHCFYLTFGVATKNKQKRSAGRQIEQLLSAWSLTSSWSRSFRKEFFSEGLSLWVTKLPSLKMKERLSPKHFRGRQKIKAGAAVYQVSAEASSPASYRHPSCRRVWRLPAQRTSGQRCCRGAGRPPPPM